LKTTRLQASFGFARDTTYLDDCLLLESTSFYPQYRPQIIDIYPKFIHYFKQTRLQTNCSFQAFCDCPKLVWALQVIQISFMIAFCWSLQGLTNTNNISFSPIHNLSILSNKQGFNPIVAFRPFVIDPS
jgi:hypothetical protein